MNEKLQIEKLIFEEKDYTQAITLIEKSQYSSRKEYKLLKANALFLQDKFAEAATIYHDTEEFYQLGYCYFLMQEIDKAIENFQKATPSPAQNWSLFFAEIFRARVNVSPSYLQIRAFLERDLNLFLKLDIVPYVQKIMDLSDYLESINPETNKYMAKAFLNNDYPNYAKEYLDRAFDITTKDAELYYLLAKYNLTQNLKGKAKENLKEAIRLSNNFVPAIMLLESVTSEGKI